jgi:hypothetical protein
LGWAFCTFKSLMMAPTCWKNHPPTYWRHLCALLNHTVQPYLFLLLFHICHLCHSPNPVEWVLTHVCRRINIGLWALPPAISASQHFTSYTHTFKVL